MPKVTELKYVKTNYKKLKINHTQVLPGKSQPSISSLIPMPAGDHLSGYTRINWATISSKRRISGVS